MNDNERYIPIKDDTDILYLCPLAAADDTVKARKAVAADICVEADVVGRYAGQILFERRRP